MVLPKRLKHNQVSNGSPLVSLGVCHSTENVANHHNFSSINNCFIFSSIPVFQRRIISYYNSTTTHEERERSAGNNPNPSVNNNPIYYPSNPSVFNERDFNKFQEYQKLLSQYQRTNEENTTSTGSGHVHRHATRNNVKRTFAIMNSEIGSLVIANSSRDAINSQDRNKHHLFLTSQTNLKKNMGTGSKKKQTRDHQTIKVESAIYPLNSEVVYPVKSEAVCLLKSEVDN